MRLQTNCPHCFKNYRLDAKWPLDDGSEIRFLKCGHIVFHHTEKLFADFPKQAINSDDAAWQYQIEGVEFFSRTGGNALIADEMGLGKTVQALLAARAMPERLNPTLIIVKSATTWQWFKQYKKWTDPSLTGIFMIRETKGFIPPGFNAYVISMDTFSRMVKAERNPYGKIINVSINPQLSELGIKFVIIDECQSFKDTSSNRTIALVAFLQSQKIPYKLFLSGTPIKNRADEYFTVLNILDPENFDSIESFRRNWLVQDKKGRWSEVSPYRLDKFRDLISDYVIRRETKDVQKDLPEFRRVFNTIYIEDEHMKKIYNAELDKLAAKAGSKEKVSYMDVSDNLMTLRRIVGMAKVQFCLEYIYTFLDTTEGEKIAIGIHHQDVRDTLYAMAQARGFNPLKLSGEDSSDKKEEIKLAFQKPEHRLLIINMLAGGVGMDGLQVCNNVICLERQWNSVDEEQFEKRFHRAGQKLSVMCEYMVAKGTIDEIFSDMVERKRKIFGKTVGLDWNLVGDSDSLNELIFQTTASRL